MHNDISSMVTPTPTPKQVLAPIWARFNTKFDGMSNDDLKKLAPHVLGKRGLLATFAAFPVFIARSFSLVEFQSSNKNSPRPRFALILPLACA